MSELLIDRVQQNLQRLRFVRAPEALSEILAQAEVRASPRRRCST